MTSHADSPLEIRFSDGTHVEIRYDGGPDLQDIVEDLVVDAVVDCCDGEELSADLARRLGPIGLVASPSARGPRTLTIR